jgi:flagellar hook-length control protein FliK
MMQNSPLLVTKVNPTNKPTEMKAKEKQPGEANHTFKQMLSKQVEQSDAKTAQEQHNKPKIEDKQQEKVKENASAEIDQSQTAKDGVPSSANALASEQELASFTDAQALASQVTTKTVKEVTDGAVDLDALKQTEAMQTGIANVTPNLVESNRVASNDVKAVDVIDGNARFVKTGFTKLSPSIQSQNVIEGSTKATTEAQTSVTKGFSFTEPSAANIDSEKNIAETKADSKNKDSLQKTDISLDMTVTGKDKLATQWSAEKSTQVIQDTALIQASNTIAEVASAQALAAQVPAKQTAPTEVVSNLINVLPGKPGWSEAIGQKVAWMVGAAEQSATLTLNPKDLGPLQIIINVNNEKADATFISDNPEVRKALEDGMSNLKQSMSQAGVELGQANVNTGKEHQAFQQANQSFTQRQASFAKENQGAEQIAQQSIITRVSNGLVDTFA